MTNPSGTAETGEIKIGKFVGGSGTLALDNSKIDINSMMHEALSTILASSDVNILSEAQLFVDSRTEANEQKLVNALNLSRPAINMPASKQPLSYSENLANSTVSGNCGGDLQFEFQIENITDPDPANTRYTCNLYIDQNGDGRHSDEELIPGITIESIINGTTKRVTNGTLQADENISYKVTRSLNSGQADQFSGVVAWKLEIVKQANSAATDAEKEAAKNVHASQKGYAYIQPTKRTELKILQVHSSANHYSNSNVDLSTPAETRENGTLIDWETTTTGNLTQFQTLYKQLYDAGMYNITVEKTETDALNYETIVSDNSTGSGAGSSGGSGSSMIPGIGSGSSMIPGIGSGGSMIPGGGSGGSSGGSTTTTKRARTKEEIFNQLNQYDMIILGFEDCYGDLEMPAANAVADYINTGKSLLFTHDTTSYWNDPNYTGAGLNNNGRKGWGYWFNQVIRDKVGLDRYGVTNPTYGKVDKGSGNVTRGDVAKGSDGLINATEAKALQQAGYTVAYVPGVEGRSALETQGYANSTIDRNTSSNTGGNKETTVVSQVNQGQITEYPYKLQKTMSVKSTHNQYYQLNMNSDDVVVWYCLGGDTFADEKNDAANTYYIYNRGNITYSGAGHTADSLTDDEARLFVNTMIAAYRAGNSAASVSFRTASDDPASALLFPVQPDENGDTSLSSAQNTYFKISDRNLTDDTTLSVELYYEVPYAQNDSTVLSAESVGITGNSSLYVKKISLGNIYYADTGTLVDDPEDLISDVLYQIAVPPAVLNYAAGLTGLDKTVKLYLVATTTIHSEATDIKYKSFDDLSLVKLGLLRLE